MPRMHRPVLAAAVAAAAFGVAQSATAGQESARDYVVVYERGASAEDARAAVEKAGGTIVSENRAIGVATVRSKESDFAARAARQAPLEGAAADRTIGHVPANRRAPRYRVERVTGTGRRAARPRRPAKGDPLGSLQWGNRMIHATPEGSYARQQGSHAVRVGIMDTGIDASHPDIAPNFDRRLSRNFTIDDPLVDGTCDTDPDGFCQDPADVDENEHGTHVAGIVGAALNGLGTAGVAPKVSLVNLRAGQDSGYFFLGPTLDALTYAGDNGIDVVNMSFFIDPWLYNCAANPADSEPEQAQQRLIIEATQRALKYARDRGVTLVAAEGNGHTDLGKPVVDEISPDYPDAEKSPRTRTIDNSCLTMPTEGNDVIGVTSVGPSKRKAYYSDYGLEQADVAAPGGDRFDRSTSTPPVSNPQDTILAPYPQAIAEERGELNPDGTPNVPNVIRDCKGRRCAYYQYLQGTSMASPHAVGVAALAVAQYGAPDGKGGVGLAPARVEQLLQGTATDTPCPEPRTFVYPGLPAELTATCEGPPERNGFYGDGIVDALGIVTAR
jgi:subtilisin family serine protease